MRTRNGNFAKTLINIHRLTNWPKYPFKKILVNSGRSLKSKNVFIRADIALSALETFLFNGLYEFTLLYLLTYFRDISLNHQ